MCATTLHLVPIQQCIGNILNFWDAMASPSESPNYLILAFLCLCAWCFFRCLSFLFSPSLPQLGLFPEPCGAQRPSVEVPLQWKILPQTKEGRHLRTDVTACPLTTMPVLRLGMDAHMCTYINECPHASIYEGRSVNKWKESIQMDFCDLLN